MELTGRTDSGTSIWHGEVDIATFSTNAGHNADHKLANLFDNDENTLWHSASDFDTNADIKRISISFQV